MVVLLPPLWYMVLVGYYTTYEYNYSGFFFGRKVPIEYITLGHKSFAPREVVVHRPVLLFLKCRYKTLLLLFPAKKEAFWKLSFCQKRGRKSRNNAGLTFHAKFQMTVDTWRQDKSFFSCITCSFYHAIMCFLLLYVMTALQKYIKIRKKRFFPRTDGHNFGSLMLVLTFQ